MNILSSCSLAALSVTNLLETHKYLLDGLFKQMLLFIFVHRIAANNIAIFCISTFFL